MACIPAREFRRRFEAIELELDDSEARVEKLVGLISQLSLTGTHDAAVLQLMQDLQTCLKQAGAQMHLVWSRALHAESTNLSFLTRFLNSRDENVVDATASTMAQLQVVGATERHVILGYEENPRSWDLKWLHVSELGSVSLDVGGQLWPSAVLLARRLWTRQGPYRLDWPRVRALELGCGVCPLPGLTLTHLGVQEVVLSDHLEAIVEAAGQSAKRNCPPHANVKLARVDCSAVSPGVSAGFGCVLASDLVYDVKHAEPLATAIKHFLAHTPAARAFVVIGDLAGRQGFPEFQSAMAGLGFEAVFEDRTTELNEFVFRLKPA